MQLKTLYTISNIENLIGDVSNTKVRENSNDIDIYNKTSNQYFPKYFQFKQNIKNWTNTKDFERVIWTNLPVNWISKIALSNRIK